MINEPSKLAEARAALEKAAEDLGDPARFGLLSGAVNFLLRAISGASRQIEKDIAKKLLLRYKNQVFSEAKVILAKIASYEPATLEHWIRVMEVFVNANLADDPEFNACKEQLAGRRNRQPIASLKPVQLITSKTEPPPARRENDTSLRMNKEEVRRILHANSLRVIGQSLEMLRLRAFRLEKTGDFYIVRSESLTATHQWILRNYLAENILDSAVAEQKGTQVTVGEGSLCYGPRDISRLNAREAKKRGNRRVGQTRAAQALAQLLRALGEHLDNKQATAFEISWAPDSVSVEYQTSNGIRERKDFTLEKLQQLALYSRYRRSNLSTSIGSAKKSAISFGSTPRKPKIG